jgi:glycogen synthase
MIADFSWDRTARQYVAIYQQQATPGAAKPPAI